METNGIAEIAEAVKELEGVESVIDAAILAASSGTLPATPGLGIISPAHALAFEGL